MLSVCSELRVSLLISVCMSLCPRFSVVVLAPRIGSAGADERRASVTWRFSSLARVAECIGSTSRCASLKGRGQDSVRNMFRQ